MNPTEQAARWLADVPRYALDYSSPTAASRDMVLDAVGDYVDYDDALAAIARRIAPGDDLDAQATAALDDTTPAPWWHDNNEGYSINKVLARHSTDPRAYEIVAEVVGDSAEAEANARFVAFTRQWVPEAAARISALTATMAEVNQRADNHWETLRSIRDIAKSSGDLARIVQWVDDAEAGYNETAETTLAAEMDRRTVAEAEAATLRDRLARMEGAQKLREEIAALEKLCDHDCDNEDCVRCFHYPEILEQKRKQLAALTDGGSNG